jgi:hypothetical protein
MAVGAGCGDLAVLLRPALCVSLTVSASVHDVYRDGAMQALRPWRAGTEPLARLRNRKYDSLVQLIAPNQDFRGQRSLHRSLQDERLG